MTTVPAGIALHRRDLAASWCDAMWSPLSDEERDRADRYLREDDRRRFVAGRHLIRTTLAPVLGCMPGDVRILIDDHGRPHAAGAPSFSLSHTGNHVVLAIAHERRWTVGIDIEAIRHDIDPFALARRICAPVELDALRRCVDDHTASFFRLWTLKEAVLKAVGKGLIVDPRTVCIDMRSDLPVILDVPFDRRNMDLSILPAPVGHVAAIAWCGR